MEYLAKILDSSRTAEMILYLMAALLAFQAIVKLVDWFREKWGFVTKAEMHEKQQQESIDCMKKDINQIKHDQENYQKEVRAFQEETVDMRKKVINALDELKEEMTDSSIVQLRHNILDFSNAIHHRNYSREQYDFILDNISTYEALIEKTGRKNGKVDAAAKYIRSRYDEYMINGFPY